MEKKINKIKDQYAQISTELADSANFGDYSKMQQLSQEKSRLEKIISLDSQINTLKKQLDENNEIIANTGEDPEMIVLAQQEAQIILKQIGQLETQLHMALLPPDPDDSKKAILEIRAGTGGDEAELFAAELLRMYLRFAEIKKLSAKNISINKTGIGGIKEAVVEINSEGAYGLLKYESGVHRVQRVPKTEKGGRLHTSAATVAVLPQASDVDIQINQGELKIDTYHASGHGGQSVNTTNSAVRITHLPTGIVISCQDERSQLKNKIKAMQVLRTKLLAQKKDKDVGDRSAKRKILIGSGDRSEKIRTYNFPQDRVTDHRINLTLHNIITIMNGNIDVLIEKLASANQQKRAEDDN